MKNQIRKSNKKIKYIIILLALLPLILPSAVHASGPTLPSLGVAGNFAILAETGISTTGVTSIIGSIGISPAATSYITGFGTLPLVNAPTGEYATSPIVSGKVYGADMTGTGAGTGLTPSMLTTAVNNMLTAYNAAQGTTVPAPVVNIGAGDLAGLTLAPGVYKFDTNIDIPSGTTLTLNCNGNSSSTFIFQTSGELTMESGATVNLEGGCQPKNIYWAIATSAILGTTTTLPGIVLTGTSVSMASGAVINGRVLAQAAVTLDANTVTAPGPSYGLNLNDVTDANSTITYGTESNFTYIGLNSTSYYRLWSNGKLITQYSEGQSIYAQTLAVGTYKVTAQSNTSGFSNVTYYETVTKATPTLAIIETGGSFLLNGTYVNATGLLTSITTINNQLIGHLYINGITELSPYKNLIAGTYTAVFNTTGNQNYTSGMTNLTLALKAGDSITIPITVPGVYPRITQIFPIVTFPTNSSFFNIGIDKGTSPTNNNLVFPVLLSTSNFSTVNITFLPNIPALHFTVNVTDVFNTAPCSLSAVPNHIQGLKLIPSISNESSAITGVKYTFALNLNGLGRTSLSDLPLNSIGLYKCNIQNDSWTLVPLTYSVSKGKATFVASSSSLSIYEIGTLPASIAPIANVTTTVSESGLPSGYTWKAAYDNQVVSATAPNNLTFNNAPDNYPLSAYSFTNASANSTEACVTTYSPINFSLSGSQSVAAGSSVTINYAGSTVCSAIVPAVFVPNDEIIFLVLIAILVIAVLTLLAILLSSRRKYVSKKESNKTNKK